jgi:hypothetical protein
MIKEVIRGAIIQAKLKTAIFIATYWTWDTYKMEKSAVTWIERCAFYDLGETFGVYVGTDAEYAKYVQNMYQRYHAGEIQTLNWTNPRMMEIEHDMLGETVKFAVKTFKETVNQYLVQVGLGWMTGRGRMPKHVEVLYNEREKSLPRFHGSEKIIQWLQ